MSTPLRLLTEKEAADALRVTEECLRKWRRARRIGFVRVGTKPLYRVEHVEEFIRNNERPALAAVAPRRRGA